ncbi:MAG: thiamine phosphate synthase [Nitriliruptorales bacterium]|nr:thiamine phosphate synthase [Nitriliruptorales bacterium]
MRADQRRARLADSVLYLCVDRRASQGDLTAFLDAVLGAGVDIVQLRDKEATPDEIRSAAGVFRAAADGHDALFILNDEPHLAVDVDADGVHVGQGDMPPEEARLLVGRDRIVGWSTHSIPEVDAALGVDCDYFAVGPVHATPTKQGRAAIGFGPVRHAAVTADRPWFVTGGMSPDTAPTVLAAGATRLVVVRALTEAGDPARVVSELAAQLRR